VKVQQEFGNGQLSGKLVGLKQQETSYKALLEEALEGAAPKRIVLNFQTATAVSGGGQQWPLPVPLLLWRGLLRRWQEFSPLALEEGLRGWWEEWLWCESYQAQAKKVFLGPKKGVFQGFVGKAVFKFKPEADPNLRRQTAALAQFAQEVGVGVNTSFGCGQVKTIIKV
jgi:CRISPR-associated endoribonuclease Cas6